MICKRDDYSERINLLKKERIYNFVHQKDKMNPNGCENRILQIQAFITSKTKYKF